MSGLSGGRSFRRDGPSNVAQQVQVAVAAATAGVGSFAEDEWVSPDSKFLYQDYPGDDKIVVYSIGADGSLTKVGE